MSTAKRLLDLSMKVAASEKTAEKWIQKAIKDPGRVHRMLGIPEGEDIPQAKIEAELAKKKAESEKYQAQGKKVPDTLRSEISALNLALRFQ